MEKYLKNLRAQLKKLVFLPRKAACLIIRSYQIVLSPDQGILRRGQAVCRFYPTCSQYCLQAIQKFGILKGTFLTVKRIGKCHPFHSGGWDPVP